MNEYEHDPLHARAYGRSRCEASGIHWNSSKAALLGTVGELRSVGSDYYAATSPQPRFRVWGLGVPAWWGEGSRKGLGSFGFVGFRDLSA